MTGLVGFPLVTRKLGTPLCRLPAKAKAEAEAFAKAEAGAEAAETAPAALADKFEIPTNAEVCVRFVCAFLCIYGRFYIRALRQLMTKRRQSLRAKQRVCVLVFADVELKRFRESAGCVCDCFRVLSLRHGRGRLSPPMVLVLHLE